MGRGLMVVVDRWSGCRDYPLMRMLASSISILTLDPSRRHPSIHPPHHPRNRLIPFALQLLLLLNSLSICYLMISTTSTTPPPLPTTPFCCRVLHIHPPLAQKHRSISPPNSSCISRSISSAVLLKCASSIKSSPPPVHSCSFALGLYRSTHILFLLKFFFSPSR